MMRNSELIPKLPRSLKRAGRAHNHLTQEVEAGGPQLEASQSKTYLKNLKEFQLLPPQNNKRLKNSTISAFHGTGWGGGVRG